MVIFCLIGYKRKVPQSLPRHQPGVLPNEYSDTRHRAYTVSVSMKRAPDHVTRPDTFASVDRLYFRLSESTRRFRVGALLDTAASTLLDRPVTPSGRHTRISSSFSPATPAGIVRLPSGHIASPERVMLRTFDRHGTTDENVFQTSARI